MDLELSGKVALVTGGSRGIGRATALTLAREGCGVAVCARGGDTLEATMAELRAVTANVWEVTADVTSESDVEGFVSRAADTRGRIDIVVCNVGGSFGGSSLEASDEDCMNTLDINLMHSVRTVRAALPHMKKS
jgi:3-oxoacyl-[acyl-carrier protein] reductase